MCAVHSCAPAAPRAQHPRAVRPAVFSRPLGTFISEPELLALRSLFPNHKPAVPANSDAEGYLEAAKPGLKHPAVRDSGRDCTWRPPVANIAPRHAGWARQQAGGS